MVEHGSRIPVAILGATGMVGQRLIQSLSDHPWFEPAELAASERSAGRTYAEATEWRLPGDPPRAVAGLQVRHVDEPLESRIVFSGLGSDVARDLESRLAGEGRIVVSNAGAHRMAPDVPLLIPEVNPDHLSVLEVQRRRTGGTGFIVTNPNCSTIGLTLALAPLHRKYGIRRAVVVTLQALSGAGYPGVPSLSVADNVVPWIGGETEKIETEPRKILGRVEGGAFAPADMLLSARVHRVPVSDGHTMTVFFELGRPPADPQLIAECLASFRGEPQEMGLPSAPRRPIHVLEGRDRPQPSLDRDRERGMAVSVGGLEVCPVLGHRMEVLVHNTVRGAAGAAVLNAELLRARGWMDS